jgi:hypothetical protein
MCASLVPPGSCCVRTIVGTKGSVLADNATDLGFPKVPIWTLYLSGTPGLFGGNYDVGQAMLFASYTDVMPSASERASLFFLTTSMQYLAQTFCPAIGAFLMNLDGHGGTPQVNLIVSLCLATLTALIAIFLFPETVHEARSNKSSTNEETEEVAESRKSGGNTMAWFRRMTANIPSSVSGVGIVNVVLLSCSICFAATGIKAIDWYALVQYPVVKLHWTFPQASSVVAMEGILMLIHFSIILPYLNRAAAARFGPSLAHFSIMAGSALLLTLGSLGMGFSNTSTLFVAGVVVYLFGEGLPTATQAFIVSLVDKAQVARVIATLSMASIFGKLAASLLFPKLLAWGLEANNDVLIGLPLFVSAALFVVSASCVGLVGLRVTKRTTSIRHVEG